MPRLHLFITPARSLTWCLALALAWPALALADTARFEITAEPLTVALKAFAQQAHMQLLYEYTIVQNVRGNPVIGVIEKHAALEELLRNTGLEAIFTSESAATIRPISARPPGEGANSSAAGAGPKIKQSAKRSPSIADSAKVEEGSTDPAKEDSTDKAPKHVALQEIVITGSRLPTRNKEGPQEVQIYDSVDIDQSGQNSISDFLGTLPAVSEGSTPGTAFGPVQAISLRGLPAGTTLVLLNGHPLESSALANRLGGGSYFDLNNLPLQFVDRIEVDENGSSAVYGSDAIAGVVNIITKKRFNGLAVNARYGSAKDDDTLSTNFTWGKQWTRGGLSVTGTYTADGGLLTSERLRTATNDYTSYGGRDANYPDCPRANIFSTNGASLPGAPAGSGATYAAVTGSIASGRPALSQFTYGELNSCSIVTGESLLPSTRRSGVLVEGHLDISQSVQLFTETIYTHDREVDSQGYQALFGLPGYLEYTVSAANPYNPFGTTVGVAQLLKDIPVNEEFTTDFFRPLVGMRGTFAHGWQWEIDAWESSDWSQELEPNFIPNTSMIQTALNSPNPATALNPFVTGPLGPPELLNSLFGTLNVKMMGGDRSAEAYIRGPLLRLPAGNVNVVVGANYDRSTLYYNLINDNLDPPNTRDNYGRRRSAAFAEVRVPLLARHEGAHSNSLLAITAAGRHDQYSDFGGATTEQFGFELRPLNSVLVRGTYSTAFQAPTLPLLYGPEGKVTAAVIDPVTGKLTFVQDVYGGNSHLQPMTGHSRSIGVVYSSEEISGLTLSATNWNVAENSYVQNLSPLQIVENEALFPGRVIRGPTGSISEVISTALNFGSINVAGIDYDLTYNHSVGAGIASFDVNAAETYHYNVALLPGSLPVDVVSHAQDSGNWAPRWKARVGAGWTVGTLSAFLDGRYTSSYQDYDSTRQIGNFWIFDANVRWDLGTWLDLSNRWLRREYIEVGAKNLFNRAPQFSNFRSGFYGYDATQTSVLGRALYVEAGARW